MVLYASFLNANHYTYLQDISLVKKKKRSKTSPPLSRKKNTKKKSKKPIYDSDSSSLSEGEIVDEKPKRKQKNTKRTSKKYEMSDDSVESSNESDSQSKIQETTQSKHLHC